MARSVVVVNPTLLVVAGGFGLERAYLALVLVNVHLVGGLVFFVTCHGRATDPLISFHAPFRASSCFANLRESIIAASLPVWISFSLFIRDFSCAASLPPDLAYGDMENSGPLAVAATRAASSVADSVRPMRIRLGWNIVDSPLVAQI